MRALLAAISLCAAVPMLCMAVRQRLDFDSWWHVFIAGESPWAPFWGDVCINAHLPVFYLLPGAAAKLRSDRLVYRSLSIAAAVAATDVIGRIATRVFRTPHPLAALRARLRSRDDDRDRGLRGP